MREPTPTPAMRRRQKKPVRDDAEYLKRGTMTPAPGRRSHGPQATTKKAPSRGLSKFQMVMLGLGVVGAVGLLVVTTGRDPVSDPAEVALLLEVDEPDCRGTSKTRDGSGALKVDRAAFDACMGDKGWFVTPERKLVKCAGICGMLRSMGL